MTKTKKEKSKIFNINILNKVLFCLIVVLGVYYLAQVNNLSVKGIVLKESKLKIKRISEENRDLELQVMTLKSYNKISQRAEEMKMVRADKVHYIEGVSTIVVKNITSR